jgi:hypothetical protein
MCNVEDDDTEAETHGKHQLLGSSGELNMNKCFSQKLSISVSISSVKII